MTPQLEETLCQEAKAVPLVCFCHSRDSTGTSQCPGLTTWWPPHAFRQGWAASRRGHPLWRSSPSSWRLSSVVVIHHHHGDHHPLAAGMGWGRMEPGNLAPCHSWLVHTYTCTHTRAHTRVHTHELPGSPFSSSPPSPGLQHPARTA